MIHTDMVLELFRQEVDELGGQVSDAVNDGQRLFARSILPAEERVSRGDTVKPGVALRCMDETIEVRPYVYRILCRNGAIMAFSDQGCSIPLASTEDETEPIRQAIHAAAAPETFHEFVRAMRESQHQQPDADLLLLTLMRHRAHRDQAIALDIIEHFRKEGVPNLFAMANAVTSVARDTRDPVKRWNLETAGAEVFARALRPAPASGFHAEQPRRFELV
jgi:hypothetical protein